MNPIELAMAQYRASLAHIVSVGSTRDYVKVDKAPQLVDEPDPVDLDWAMDRGIGKARYKSLHPDLSIPSTGNAVLGKGQPSPPDHSSG